MQENINDTKVVKRKRQKPSILDPFKSEIKNLVDLGLSPTNIKRLMNEKVRIDLDVSTYWYFINKRIKNHS